MNLNYDIYKLQFYNIYGNTVKTVILIQENLRPK